MPYVTSGPVNDADQRYRADARWKLDVAPRDYVQTFANRNGSHLLTVKTIVPRPDVIVEPIPGRIGPWKLYDGSGEYLGLTLSNGNIAVFLSSNWLDFDQLRALAADISQRPQAEPGWDIDELPADVIRSSHRSGGPRTRYRASPGLQFGVLTRGATGSGGRCGRRGRRRRRRPQRLGRAGHPPRQS